MAPINQILKGSANIADDLARYTKACGKRNIFEIKPATITKDTVFAYKPNYDKAFSSWEKSLLAEGYSAQEARTVAKAAVNETMISFGRPLEFHLLPETGSVNDILMEVMYKLRKTYSKKIKIPFNIKKQLNENFAQKKTQIIELAEELGYSSAQSLMLKSITSPIIEKMKLDEYRIYSLIQKIKSTKYNEYYFNDITYFESLKNDLLKIAKKNKFDKNIKEISGVNNFNDLEKVADNFSNDINNFINELNRKIPTNKSFVESVKQSDKVEDLYKLINELEEYSLQRSKNMTGLGEICLKEDIPALTEQAQKLHGDTILKIQKIIANQSKDHNIIALEQKIKELYNLDFIHIENIEQGKKLLSCLEIAKKECIQRPKNIIFTHYLKANGEALSHTNGDLSVLIRANNVSALPEEERLLNKLLEHMNSRKQAFTTSDPRHTIMHEIVHGEIGYVRKPEKYMIEKYQKTIDNLAYYAKENVKKGNWNEVYVELRTKELLEGLNKEEKNLLNFIEDVLI